MKDSLAVGLESTRNVEIDKVRTISFMGDELRVYGTPYMVRDVEETARLLIQEHLDPGEQTVGAHVSIDHLGATLIGQTVAVHVEITGVDGRRIMLKAGVHDGIDEVGRAKHTRFVIDEERQRERLEKKRAQLSGG
ncbi:MAG: LysR family transcriptional regulator [Alphaproteobacteria bacterium]|jgi:fluoroacetyl-CoA thioesterase